jgi:hypothetical protein
MGKFENQCHYQTGIASRVGTHLLQAQGIKKSFENTFTQVFMTAEPVQRLFEVT